MGSPYVVGWPCYQPGQLNPDLIKPGFYDVLSNSIASYSGNPMSSIGEAVNRLIRPDFLRGTNSISIKAVVLGGYVAEGREALSYNVNIESADQGALANRVQVLYIRVPELTILPDPYCKDHPSPMLVDPIVEMHPTAVLPNWKSAQPSIMAGTIVELEFIEGNNRAIVKNILEEATSFVTVFEEISAKNAFVASGNGTFIDPTILPEDPGNCPWSYGALAHETVWKSNDYPQYNEKILRNGLLEETGMLVYVNGARLVPPAAEDFKKLAAAFKKKFGQRLTGTGYRTYAKQVELRMMRVTPGNPCGEGKYNAKGKDIGITANPGQSNHGWGAAVDLRRKDWEHGATYDRDLAGTSKHFRWINKFSKDFNFVFGVSGEHWHLDWIKFSSQTTGWGTTENPMRRTRQTSWTTDGQDDPSITKT
tara:strand:+ start:210 stop:1475 length:1266 start_codon:yes stop_codon:yes gene_type:complete